MLRVLECKDRGNGRISISFGQLNTNEGRRSRRPRYAILSHRWGADGDEVTFKDFLDGKEKSKKGYAKIEGCCRQALRDGIHHVWIDSCCIDKSSSAELSEAINSMYKYYRKAEVCYAYLQDVPDASEDPRKDHSHFRRSEWFTRGWTLQELLAPATVVFFDTNWIEMGCKTGLAEVIGKITRIDKEYLEWRPISEANIAQRMCWASARKTTRVEDTAYSLMGIFDVNMPVIYGEGDKAFTRLQLEILKTSCDHTIFTWDKGFLNSDTVLAPSPVSFHNGCRIERIPHEEWASSYDLPKDTARFTHAYSLTNSGLHIWLPLVYNASVDGFWAALACRREGSHIFMRLKKASGANQFYKIRQCFFGMNLFLKRLSSKSYLFWTIHRA